MEKEKKKLDKTKKKSTPKVKEKDIEEDHDYGGFPNEADLRKNLGCG